MNILMLLAAMLVPGRSPAEVKIDLTRPLAVGRAFEYRGTIMEGVARYRGLGWVKGIHGFVSVPDCRHVGDLVYAEVGPERGWWRVADCSNPRHLAAQRAKRLVIEVQSRVARAGRWDYYTQGGPGHAPARVYTYREMP